MAISVSSESISSTPRQIGIHCGLALLNLVARMNLGWPNFFLRVGLSLLNLLVSCFCVDSRIYCFLSMQMED